MKISEEQRRAPAKGFSLLELLVVVAILMLVMAAIFEQINLVQKRYRTEEAKVDISQESREFLDQIVRDIHQAGYPNMRMYTSIPTTPWQNDGNVAVGLVKFSYTDLWFEGDADGDGTVESIRYTLAPGPNGNCPCTMRRAQIMKQAGTAPMSQATSSNYSTGLDGVVNSAGTYTISGNTTFNDGTSVSNQSLYGVLAANPVFTAQTLNGTAVTPCDITSNPTALASIKTIVINLNVLVKANQADFDTRMRPALSLSASARVSN